MKKGNSKTKAFAFLGAAFVLLIALIGCKQTVGGNAPKHDISFNVEGDNGTLKATAEGIAETDKSPISVEQGKVVTFTATPGTNYRVKEWKVDGKTIAEAGKSTEYKHTVTKPCAITVSFEIASVEGGAVLILSPDKLTIEVKAKTSDGSAIVVEGCAVATLANEAETTLTAKDTRVVLKGDITELYFNDNKLSTLNVQGLTSLQKLYCSKNQLTALNMQGLTTLKELVCGKNQLTELDVQGFTALQWLECNDNKLAELNVQGLIALQVLGCWGNQLTTLDVQDLAVLQDFGCDDNKLVSLNVKGCASLKTVGLSNNKLNAEAFIKIFNDLPERKESGGGRCVLYTEETDVTEGNCKDFSTPENLNAAFEGAKAKHWEMFKLNEHQNLENI